MKTKKSKTFRFACGLFILCLLTTCVVGTTLAKYTTSGSASDQARVAKWGVSLTIQADQALKSEYKNAENQITVKSSSTDKIVAPGTSGSTKFSISGTPEVATHIDVTLSGAEDVWLKEGTYDDDTTIGSFTLATAYYPVVWTLKQTKNRNGNMSSVQTLKTGKLSDIAGFLQDYTKKADYAPNTKLDAEFELSWEWAIEKGTTDDEKALHNKCDTYLGNLMANHISDTAGENQWKATNYCLKVGYTLSITVTQVD